MIRKALRHGRNRRAKDPSSLPQPTPIVATVSSTGTTNITIDFDQPVSVSGKFGIEVDDLTTSGQVVTSPTQITLVASGNVATKDWTIPVNDPNVRNAQGGYVASANGTF